jgi:hypothetical protein
MGLAACMEEVDISHIDLIEENVQNRQFWRSNLVHFFFLWLDSYIWAWANWFRPGFTITLITDLCWLLINLIYTKLRDCSFKGLTLFPL